MAAIDLRQREADIRAARVTYKDRRLFHARNLSGGEP
jgi:hypothetical protein